MISRSSPPASTQKRRTVRNLALPFILVVLCAASVCFGDDWPTWQHDNRRSGTTSEQLDTQTLELRWTWRSSAPPQTAWAGPAKYDAYAFHRNLPSMRNYDAVFHPIAVGERIWFGSSVDDTLYCLNAVDGREQWTMTTDGPLRLSPTWSGGRVFFGSDDGYARCVDAETGELVWQFSPAPSDQRVINNGRLIPFQPCRTGVVVDKSTAWFACAMLPWKDAYLCALDASTGKVETPNHYVRKLPGRTMEGPPALSSGALILPQGRVAPRVFDRLTGDDLGEMAKSGGGSVVVVTLDDKVLHGPASDSRKGGFRQSDGKSKEMVAALGRGNALVVDGTHAWMLTDDAIVASDLSTNVEHWKVNCDCPFSMIKAGDTLFVGGDRLVAAYSADSGERRWAQKTDGRIFGLVAANGRLIASSDTGVIHCFSTGTKHSSPIPPTFAAPDSITAADSDPKAESVADVAPIDDDRLLGQWAFQQSYAVGTELRARVGRNLTLSKPGRFSDLGDHQALELDGEGETAMVSPSFQNAPHPSTAFSAEAWVRIDQLLDWGGIIGIVQDNGSDEKGWLLGYRKDRFCVAVRSVDGPDKLTYLTDEKPLELSRWHHVVGTYDGNVLRLFVDGNLRAESDAPSGKIVYPPRAWFEIGAYHDNDEYHRMKGAIHELRLYNEALDTKEIAAHYWQTKSRIPEQAETIELASGPWLAFEDSSTATVQWSTAEPQLSRLDYGISDFDQTVVDQKLRRDHRVQLTGLRRNGVYRYRIGLRQGDETRFTEEYECDNFFNYSRPIAAREIGNVSGADPIDSKDFAKRFLEQTDRRRGMGLIIGSIEVPILLELCRQSELRFVIAETDKKKVDSLRTELLRHGVYGNQVTVHRVTDPSDLPMPGNWADLVVAMKPRNLADVLEAQHQTRPDGGVTLVFTRSDFDIPPGFESLRWKVASEKGFVVFRIEKPALEGSGEWSHLYGTPDNSAFGGEQLAGASSAEELEVHWVGRPGPRYQADRSGRKPSPLAVGGRLFLQGLHRIVAVNSFNGTILWSLEIPDLERFNMPRDCSNWCATRDFFFVAVKGECWKISTNSGEVVARVPAAGPDAAIAMDWGHIATEGNRLFGSTVRKGSSWTSFWGGGDAGWYDARSGSVTFPICSDELFCRDADSLNLNWEYKRGVVLNSTITTRGDTMYFVESRDEQILQSDQRRIGDPRLWQDLYLVAIDSETGSQRWEQKLAPMKTQVVCYLAHSQGRLILVSSSDQSYRVESFDDRNGKSQWTQSTEWPGGKGDHGKAMMRPAIVGNRIYLRPHVLSLRDGSVLDEKMPDGHGCGTYSCTSQSVIYRARTVTMWTPETNQKSTWPRLRPDCWLSTIPADGMLLSPEGGGGCSCGSWMETSIGFMPRMDAEHE